MTDLKKVKTLAELDQRLKSDNFRKSMIFVLCLLSFVYMQWAGAADENPSAVWFFLILMFTISCDVLSISRTRKLIELLVEDSQGPHEMSRPSLNSP